MRAQKYIFIAGVGLTGFFSAVASPFQQEGNLNPFGCLMTEPSKIESLLLPLTEQKENIKGPYSEYAYKYLGLKNIITENTTTYQISDVDINTASEPDPNQYYFVETNCPIFLGLKMFKPNSSLTSLSIACISDSPLFTPPPGSDHIFP